MTKRKRHVLIGVGTVVAIVVVVAAVLIATLDQDRAKKYISARSEQGHRAGN